MRINNLALLQHLQTCWEFTDWKTQAAAAAAAAAP
jgi:hypothetical protein